MIGLGRAVRGGRGAPERLDRTGLAVIALLLGLAAVAWAGTVRQSAEMGGMATGLIQVGTRMPAEVTVPLFLSMWLAMTGAMMLPAVAPMVLAHRMVIERRGEGWPGTAAFVVGYLGVWTLIGLGPLAALIAFQAAPAGPWWPRAAGAVLVLAGAYQFTSWKLACLRACRSPLAFLLSHDFDRGPRGALGAGVRHGAYCVGCCWAVMSVLLAVGLMNLAWMAALATLFFLEKNWRGGVGLAWLAGGALTVAGLAALIDPGLLVGISGGAAAPVSGGHM